MSRLRGRVFAVNSREIAKYGLRPCSRRHDARRQRRYARVALSALGRRLRAIVSRADPRRCAWPRVQGKTVATDAEHDEDMRLVSRAAQDRAGGEGHPFPTDKRAHKSAWSCTCIPADSGAWRLLRPTPTSWPAALRLEAGTIPAIAVTDHGVARGVPGYVEAASKKYGVKIIWAGGGAIPFSGTWIGTLKPRTGRRPAARRGVYCLRYRDDQPAPGHEPRSG
ncbi:MAG: hypothetical protein ACLSHG_11705 [Oscillospiraceae bacterium]